MGIQFLVPLQPQNANIYMQNLSEKEAVTAEKQLMESTFLWYEISAGDRCRKYIPQPFYGPFSRPGPPGRTGARRELLDFMVQGEINRGRHADYPAGRPSIRTNQCAPPPSPHIFLRARCPSCCPTNSVKALKATTQFTATHTTLTQYN